MIHTVEHFVEQIYCMGGVKGEQVIAELVKFGLRNMYREGY
jgi:hypothetical protein